MYLIIRPIVRGTSFARLRKRRWTHAIKKSKFDESKLTPRQRKGYEIAKAQGAKTIASIDELRLDIDADELEEFVHELDAERQRARQQTAKSYF